MPCKISLCPCLAVTPDAAGDTMDSMADLYDRAHSERDALYCPVCKAEVSDPLVCGDCGAVICRKCGTPLEKIDELGIG